MPSWSGPTFVLTAGLRDPSSRNTARLGLQHDLQRDADIHRIVTARAGMQRGLDMLLR
jgi:hypothetical protein